MEDKAFLRYALEQSFTRPIIDSAEGLSMLSTENHGYIFHDIRNRNVLDYVLTETQIRKYFKQIDSDTRRVLGLYAEYDLYKHDVRENIVIPEDYAEVALARKQYHLLSVNRQSAQKKRICARIIPAAFTDKMRELHPQYRLTMQNIEMFLNTHQEAVNLSLINDFAVTYRQIMRRFKPTYPLFWLNKKRMNYYLNEAAQILKASCPLPEDFDETHRFIGENSRLFKKSALMCQANCRQLVAMVQKMAQEPTLLNMVQTLLADRKKYAETFNTYRKERQIPDVSKISTLRHSAQKLFECYAFLNYLNGVKFAFENKYLDECPVSRQPALPTVSPQEELKKVVQIVIESQKLSTNGSKIAQIYTQAFKDYTDALQIITKIIRPA